MTNPRVLRESIKDHFDAIAPEYDQFKTRSHYYYSQLKALLSELIPNASTQHILEIGCGTGALLASLNPARGMGIDISPNMIDLARLQNTQNNSLAFEVGEAETLVVQDEWEIVFMVDLIEHLYNPQLAINHIGTFLKPRSRLIITWANHLWAPVLHVLERLKMKMPEGPHVWEPGSTVVSRLISAGFAIESTGTRCLIPAAIPGADWINRNGIRLPLLEKLGLIRFIVAVRC